MYDGYDSLDLPHVGKYMVHGRHGIDLELSTKLLSELVRDGGHHSSTEQPLSVSRRLLFICSVSGQPRNRMADG